jgi:hypothetical protein
LLDDQNPINSVYAFGDGLRQAQVGVQTSFTVDARAAFNPSDDVKVVVTSKMKRKYDEETHSIYFS